MTPDEKPAKLLAAANVKIVLLSSYRQLAELGKVGQPPYLDFWIKDLYVCVFSEQFEWSHIKNGPRMRKICLL